MKRSTILRQRKTTRVTTASLYDALFQLDKGISERFTSIQDSINGLHERMTVHEREHNSELASVTVDKQIKLDAKKAGIGAAIASSLVVLLAAIKELIAGRWTW